MIRIYYYVYYKIIANTVIICVWGNIVIFDIKEDYKFFLGIVLFIYYMYYYWNKKF
jgi:hypothetical protein